MRRLSLAAALLAWWARALFSAMPPPLHDRVAVEIPPDRRLLFPGAPNGSAVPADLSGAFRPNERLKGATRMFEDRVVGSESVAITPSGTLVMIDRYGFVFRAYREQTTYELRGTPLYIGPGRPLGFHTVGEDGMYVCDSLKGLLFVNLTSGIIEVVSNAISPFGDELPQPISYVNDLDISSDGSVFFTSCTEAPVARNAMGFYDTLHSYLLSTLRGAADGRLLKFDPTTRRTSVLATGFSYANGVALNEDESWVAVVETNLARIHRHWLKGPRRGETEVLIDKLPGFPDNLSRSPDGGFWLALPAPLSPLPLLLAPHRWVRQLLSHAIHLMPLKKWGAVVKLNNNGQPVEALYDMEGSRVSSVSGVAEHEGRLFIGNLAGNFVSFIDLN